MLRYLTGGESHGRCLVSIVDGVPAGLRVDTDLINRELSRRMSGYGRGKRMKIEKDRVEILSGMRRNKTIGSPITLMIRNLDHTIDRLSAVLKPRPGHADLAGILKYDRRDIRDVLERASARETASRVAVGSIAKMLLAEFGVRVASHVIVIGRVKAEVQGSLEEVLRKCERSPVRCADTHASKLMQREIDDAMKTGDTVGGVFEVIIRGLPPGLGSYAQWDRRIDAILAKALTSVHAVKGVSFGSGFEMAQRRGSEVHDEIFYDKRRGFYRKTNNAGGIEGGMTNGEDVKIQAAMKPISTLRQPLASVNIKSKKAQSASVERSDTCAVPACGIIGEAVCVIAIADAMCEKFGGDSIEEMRRNYKGFVRQIKKF